MSRSVIYVIYCHTNLLNGKCYVGQTKGDVMKQWKHRHVHLANKGAKFHLSNAIRLYGSSDDVWRHQVLQDGLLTKEDANIAESHWIKVLRSSEPEFGYNMTLGGDGSPGYKHTKEQRRAKSERQRNKKRGSYVSDVFGEKNPMFGKRHSEETKQHMSESHKGRPSPLKGRSWSTKRRAAQEAKKSS